MRHRRVREALWSVVSVPNSAVGKPEARPKGATAARGATQGAKPRPGDARPGGGGCFDIPTQLHRSRHTYIHTYIHTYMHTYIHTYIHTRRCPLLRGAAIQAVGSKSMAPHADALPPAPAPTRTRTQPHPPAPARRRPHRLAIAEGLGRSCACCPK